MHVPYSLYPDVNFFSRKAGKLHVCSNLQYLVFTCHSFHILFLTDQIKGFEGIHLSSRYIRQISMVFQRDLMARDEYHRQIIVDTKCSRKTTRYTSVVLIGSKVHSIVTYIRKTQTIAIVDAEIVTRATTWYLKQKSLYTSLTVVMHTDN